MNCDGGFPNRGPVDGYERAVRIKNLKLQGLTRNPQKSFFVKSPVLWNLTQINLSLHRSNKISVFLWL